MTLTVTAATADYILQVSDRRFIVLDDSGRGRRISTDEGNKQLVVVAPRLVMGVTFTGLAELGLLAGKQDRVERFTSTWMMMQISKAKAPEEGMDACAESLRSAADLLFDELYQRHERRYPHSFVLAGYESGDLRPRLCMVTNCVSPSFKTGETEAEFSVRRIESRRPFCLAGLTAAFDSDAPARIRALARKRPRRQVLADLVINEIRRAASHGKYGSGIGRECMALFLGPDGTRESMYYPTHGLPVTYGPNILDATSGTHQYIANPAHMSTSGPLPPGTDLVFGSGTPIRDRRSANRRQ
jgi:hypothetical protein